MAVGDQIKSSVGDERKLLQEKEKLLQEEKLLREDERMWDWKKLMLEEKKKRLDEKLHPKVKPSIRAERYKLNIYSTGGHFKAHVDTPRSKEMFGSLVVCLPSQFTGGELVTRHQGRQVSHLRKKQSLALTLTLALTLALALVP